jgi:hypothetical protein
MSDAENRKDVYIHAFTWRAVFVLKGLAVDLGA